MNATYSFLCFIYLNIYTFFSSCRKEVLYTRLKKRMIKKNVFDFYVGLSGMCRREARFMHWAKFKL